jgi:polysaccharide biosynthesis/export protein
MRHSTPRHLLLALCGAALLSGCALAPGGHISYRTDAAPLDDLVDIEPITPGLVASWRNGPNGVSQARPMSSELRDELAEWEYRIGPGDVLNIIVYDHPELTIPAGGERPAAETGNQVRNDGTIFYPFIGRVHVADRTLDEVREELTRRLSTYITDPQIDVGVADFRSQKVHVSGSVGAPGTVPVTSVPLTVADAISQVGGAQLDANWHNIILTRDGEEQRLSLYALLRQGDMTHNRLLRDGDVLHVPSAEDQAVAVMGQVRGPGNIPLGNERLSLTDAISRAGGVLETSAEPSGIFVIRAHNEASDKLATVYQLDIRNATAFTLGSRFPLEPQDVIYVTTAPLARWNRVISLLLPSVALPGTVADTTTDMRDL